jgi:hypothetical protein
MESNNQPQNKIKQKKIKSFFFLFFFSKTTKKSFSVEEKDHFDETNFCFDQFFFPLLRIFFIILDHKFGVF